MSVKQVRVDIDIDEDIIRCFFDVYCYGQEDCIKCPNKSTLNSNCFELYSINVFPQEIAKLINNEEDGENL